MAAVFPSINYSSLTMIQQADSELAPDDPFLLGFILFYKPVSLSVGAA